MFRHTYCAARLQTLDRGALTMARCLEPLASLVASLPKIGAVAPRSG